MAATPSEVLARQVRRHAVQMCASGQSSHVGSCLSVADILAVLYSRVMAHDPGAPRQEARDRLILSKGHAGAALYAVLAECGYFDVSRLADHYADGSLFSGHVSHKGIPGVEVSTGSLGHGLPLGTGMALGLRNGASRVFVVLSEGDCNEGSTWEAAMFAGHHQLGNLTAVIDYNRLQSLAPTEATLELEPFGAKWRSFGWEVATVNGHDHDALAAALQPRHDRPTCIIASTTKGHGVPFMENSVLWHYRSPSPSELDAALAALEGPG